MKRIAMFIYDNISLQEVTCLTSALTIWYGEHIDYLASEKRTYLSEEGLQVIPTKTFDEISKEELYDCIILPGTINPLPALFDNKLIGYLSKYKGTEKVIASISSSPLFLLKSGVLQGHKYTAGFFMQMANHFDFIDTKNFLHQPLVEDGNIITAIGFAFREFAIATLNKLEYDPGENFMSPINKEYSEAELTFYWNEEDYKEFLDELDEFLDFGCSK